MLRVAGSYNPRPKDFLNVQQMFHDVYYTRFTRLDNGEVESWDLYVTLLDWHLKLRATTSTGCSTSIPTYERLFEPFEISPGVLLLPGEYRFTRFRSNLLSTADEAAAVGQHQPDVWRLLVGQGRAGDDEPHLQAPAAVHDQREHEPDVCAAAGRPLHRPHLHVQRQLRGVAVAVAVESDSVRQPVPEPGLAEPRPLDAAARQRPVLRVQPGLDPGEMAATFASGRRTARSPRSFSTRFAFDGQASPPSEA